MKNVMRLVLGAAVLCGWATLAQADDALLVKVPFAFVVGTTTLPAGDYVIARDASHPEVVAISTADGGQTMLVLTRRAGDVEKDQPALAFERVGTAVYLTQVTLGPGNSRDIQGAPAADDDEPRR